MNDPGIKIKQLSPDITGDFLDMYLKNGFHIDKEFKDYYIVRRKL